ncbi:MAG: mechanosensitive ion channel family protein, partial [Candidatus Syntrophosphaera sp.]
MSEFFTPERINLILRAVLTLAIGIPILYLLKGLVKKLVTGKMSIQAGRLVVKAVFYIGFIIILAMVLNEFGFKLSALLGAAGIAGIALGFAAQTSVSNLISGFFLIAEKPFEIGDVIQVGETIGFVVSIDSLSIKLKTFDNRFVRVPNENMIKTEVTNITRFPERRVNVDVSVAYKEDLTRCVAILK